MGKKESEIRDEDYWLLPKRRRNTGLVWQKDERKSFRGSEQRQNSITVFWINMHKYFSVLQAIPLLAYYNSIREDAEWTSMHIRLVIAGRCTDTIGFFFTINYNDDPYSSACASGGLAYLNNDVITICSWWEQAPTQRFEKGLVRSAWSLALRWEQCSKKRSIGTVCYNLNEAYVDHDLTPTVSS